MENKFSKNISYLLLVIFTVFFLLDRQATFAQPFTGTETVSVSATVAGTVVVTPGGGGSTSGSVALPHTAVSFFGEAYPYAPVTLLKQGQVKTTVRSNIEGKFSITLEEAYDSNVLYSLFAEDLQGNRSLLLNYPIAVKVGFITTLSGIRFAPTIVTDKLAVRAGDYLTINGYALPNREMEVTMQGQENKIFTLTSRQDGIYKIVLPTSGLPKGEYVVFINYIDDARFSKLVKFNIGNSNIFYNETLTNIPGDCNRDKIINLIDFSILAFWYGKINPPKCVDTNHDNTINLVDFSILAFYWTG